MARLDSSIDELASAFVLVRLTKMDEVDLEFLQFDYDLTWAAVFLNADGTVYGRYGSRNGSPETAEELISTASLKRAMKAALELHREYPKNRGVLVGKKNRPVEWSRPADFPVAKRSTHGSCVHCHDLAEGVIRGRWARGEPPTDATIWPFPTADRVGIRFDLDHGTRIGGVAPRSLADNAGLKPGDVLLRAGGQAVLSHADLQWVLHHTPKEVDLNVDVERDSVEVALVLPLRGDWRRGNGAWRESRWALRPGMKLENVDAMDRRTLDLDLDPDTLALRVIRVAGSEAREAGFENGDVLIEVGGNREQRSEGEFLAWLYRNYQTGDQVPVVAMRGDQTLHRQLTIP